MQGPEKNSYKEFDNEKKFLPLENSPPPPHNFSNGPSLKHFRLRDNVTRAGSPFGGYVCHEKSLAFSCSSLPYAPLEMESLLTGYAISDTFSTHQKITEPP